MRDHGFGAWIGDFTIFTSAVAINRSNAFVNFVPVLDNADQSLNLMLQLRADG